MNVIGAPRFGNPVALVNAVLPQAAFFDFDGVLVDSVPLKTAAYCEIFQPFGARAVKLIREYHEANGGVDRYRKIAYVLQAIDQMTAAGAEELAQRFAHLVEEKVIQAPGIKAGQRLLRNARLHSVDCHIVSGTPEIELKRIVRARGMEEDFLSINGSPRTKFEIIGHLIEQKGYELSRCIMIGDSMTDFAAAQSAGIWFFGFPQQAGAYAGLW